MSEAWSKHYRDVWSERAGDPRLPTWVRVASYAYGAHAANGHALLRKSTKSELGTLAVVLAEVDVTSGEIVHPHRNSIRRAINRAVEFGWLAEGSCSACLIVPGHAVAYGVGNAHAPCPATHGTVRGRPAWPGMRSVA